MFDTRRCFATSPTVRKRSTKEGLVAEELPGMLIRWMSIAMARFLAQRDLCDAFALLERT